MLCLGLVLAVEAVALSDDLFPHQGDLTLPVGTTIIPEGVTTGIEEGNLYIPPGATLRLGANSTFVWNPGYSIVNEGEIATDTGARLLKGYLCVGWQEGDACWRGATFSAVANCAHGSRWADLPPGVPECEPLLVVFPDSSLEAAIRDAIEKPTGDIYDADLFGLASLYARFRGIRNLEGLQYCTDLTEINLHGNDIADVGPLSRLSGLTRLLLMSNRIVDIDGLAGLSNLTELDLNDNLIVDISALSALTKLWKLSLHWNKIADISALAGLTNLTGLWMSFNEIADITPLSGLTNLQILFLGVNQIDDVSALSGLSNLRILQLRSNSIRDISVLSGLSSLTNLLLEANRIGDITALASLTNLSVLRLSHNEIVDISPLAGLSNLTELWLADNAIADIAALVSNGGIGSGDDVDVRENYLSLDPGSMDMRNIDALLARGALVQYIPQNENQLPDADAGHDLTVTDGNDDGQGQVTLDGSGSSDPDGSIVSWVWTEGGGEIATGETPHVTFALGTHTVTLTVTDNDGATDTDIVEVTVLPPIENRAPETSIDIAAISSDSGIAQFTWSGTDDRTASESLEYSYQLLGSSQPGWSAWSSSTGMIYEGLAPGDYTFQVRARDGDGAIDPSAAMWEFAVEEPTGTVPVIVIPGIMGSHLCTVSSSPRLYLWNPDWKTQDLASILVDKTLGPILSDPELELLGWSASEDAYGGLLDELALAGRQAPFYLLYPYERFESSGFRNVVADSSRTLSPADDVFVFPYDWRQDIKEIATDNLKRMVEKILEVTGEDQVDIVAHSMGGIVARYYINEAGGAQKVRKIVMVGVPHFGSVDAYAALHPDLGCMQLSASLLGSLHETVCLKGVVSSLAGSFLSSYELLPMQSFFDLLEYFFVVESLLGESGPLDGGGSTARALRETYFENDSSKLSNADAVTTALNLHNRMGSTIETSGEVFVLTEWGIVTPRSLIRTWKPLWIPGATASLGWSVDFAPGDGRVLATIGEGLELVGGGELWNYSLFTSVPHGEMLNDETISGFVCSILDGKYRDSSWSSKGIYLDRSGPAIAPPALEYTTYRMCSDTVFHLFDSGGHHIGPTGDGVIETTPTAQYLVLGDSVVAAAPSDGEHRIEIEPCEACFGNTRQASSNGSTGVFTFVITQQLDDVATAQFLFEEVTVADQSWRGEIRFNAVDGAPPHLEVDADNDGDVDSDIAATAANTPVGFAGVLSFEDGQITIAFEGVESAGHTVCTIVDAPAGISSSFHPVTPYYTVGSSAAIRGNAEVTIKYAKADTPPGREPSLGVYRIRSADQIVDITTKRDADEDTVTGETGGLSYFVVGYLNASPEASILFPQAGDAVAGGTCLVRWQATDPDDPTALLLVDLFYSSDGGASWSLIAADEDNDSAYSWDTSDLTGGEYWLKLVAADRDGAVSEAINGPFVITSFEGAIAIGPNPVTSEGAVFFYSLAEGISSARLAIFSMSGRLVFESHLDVTSTRFPVAGVWDPVNQSGIPLANGPYVYVLVADGRVVGQGKMVIHR